MTEETFASVSAAVLCATFFGLTGYAIGAHNVERAAPSPSSTAPAPSSSSPVPVDPDDIAIRIKNEAIRRCETGGGIVTMGFGFHVVCLKPQCVEWTRDPHFPKGAP